MQRSPAFVDDATVSRLLPPADVLAVIAGAFSDPPIAPPRLVATSDEGEGRSRTLLTMPALRPGGIAAVKVVSVAHGSSIHLASHVLAISPAGELLAVIEAHQLTALRTAAASVLAAQVLGAGQARHLAVLGAGRQARAQLEAYASALPLETVALWARRPEPAEALAQFARQWPLTVQVAHTASDAVREADIVTCATASREPLVLGHAIAKGAHIDLVGGFRADMREGDDALIARSTVVADTPAALTEAGDLVQPIARGLLAASEVLLLADVLAVKPLQRRGEITLFKSVGHAAEDLVVVELLLERLGLAPGSRNERKLQSQPEPAEGT